MTLKALVLFCLNGFMCLIVVTRYVGHLKQRRCSFNDRVMTPMQFYVRADALNATPSCRTRHMAFLRQVSSFFHAERQRMASQAKENAKPEESTEVSCAVFPLPFCLP